MNLIEQRYSGDCVVASLAMFLGKPYEEVVQHFPEHVKNKFRTGVRINEMIKVAREQFNTNIVSLEGTFRHDRRYLLNIKSLNRKGKLHMVYLENYKLYDPSVETKYRIVPDEVEDALIRKSDLREGENYWEYKTFKKRMIYCHPGLNGHLGK